MQFTKHEITILSYLLGVVSRAVKMNTMIYFFNYRVGASCNIPRKKLKISDAWDYKVIHLREETLCLATPLVKEGWWNIQIQIMTSLCTSSVCGGGAMGASDIFQLRWFNLDEDTNMLPLFWVSECLSLFVFTCWRPERGFGLCMGLYLWECVTILLVWVC